MGLTLLSDFDGVWTDQRTEAEEILAVFEGELGRLVGQSVGEVRAGIAPVVDAVHRSPGRFGWAPDGRISAYVDEDPLLRTNAYASALASSDAGAPYHAAAIAEFGSIADFGNHCFSAGTASYRENHEPCMVNEAFAAMSAILELGVTVFVVSNSHAAKVVPWLRSAGIDAGVDEGVVRVVGDARKWWLGERDDGFEVGGRFVRTHRPYYETVIERTNPDVIIGDVFSLDLALPHAMRQAGNPAAPSHLALRRHPHSPAWVVDARADGAIDHVLSHPAELADVLSSLA